VITKRENGHKIEEISLPKLSNKETKMTPFEKLIKVLIVEYGMEESLATLKADKIIIEMMNNAENEKDPEVRKKKIKASQFLRPEH